MFISIIMTTYNAAQYLHPALLSIGNQSHHDYEIIIVDDGSTDDTKSIIEEFKLEHPDINLKAHFGAHTGRALALNLAVMMAQSEWIAILDADDLWHPEKLELQVSVIKKYHYDFVATDSIPFHKASSLRNHININYQISDIDIKEISFSKLLFSNFICHSSVLARKELLHYNPSRKKQIDYEAWLRLASQHKKLFLLTKPLVYHRIHPNQSFESNHTRSYILSSIKLQLFYCYKQKQFILSILLIIKLMYYIFLPRKTRLRLRHLLLTSKILNAS